MKKAYSIFERLLVSPIHTILFSIYYVARIYTFNIHGVPFGDFVRPLLISIIAASIAFLVFLSFTRSSHTSAFMTSALLFLFYFYSTAWAVFPFKTQALLSAFPFIWMAQTLAILAWFGWNRRRNWNVNAIASINLMAIVLVMFPILQGIRYAVARQQPLSTQNMVRVESVLPETPPDVYYIILDSYPRSDVLNTMGYDNSEFEQALRDLGFYVATCSQSNYSSTALSLASTLNMDYLQTLSSEIRPEEVDLLPAIKMLGQNTVRAAFSDMGYKVISFESGFPWAEWRDADIFIAPPYGPATEFETVILLSTYGRVLHDMGFIDLANIQAERFRVRTRLVLDSFEFLAQEDGPKFVYMHLIVPHPPFAFDENGNSTTPGQSDFVTQVKFINKFILPRLKTLIAESDTPPVILLQGDHGPMDTDQKPELRILNAYYLPGGSASLYPAISPVNSFRVVFNTYFGTDLPLLDDTSYYSDGKRYDFKVRPNSCP